MAKQILNYKKGKNNEGNLMGVKLLLDREVMVDLPLCLVEFDEEYVDPVLFGAYKGIPIVHERQQVLNHINETMRNFYIKEDKKGNLKEVEEAEADYTFLLPKETDVSELYVEEGQLKRKVITETIKEERENGNT